MTFTAPQSVVPTGDERELLLRFLHRQREEVVSTTVGLTDDQARWTPDGRLTSIVGILNHLTRVEWRWIEARYLDAPIPTGGEEFAVAADDTLAGVIDRYWQRGRRTDAQVRAAPGLEVPCLGCLGDPPTAAHTVYGLDQPVDLRWVLLHLIEETAHHAGHADSTREMLDGTTMR